MEINLASLAEQGMIEQRSVVSLYVEEADGSYTEVWKGQGKDLPSISGNYAFCSFINQPFQEDIGFNAPEYRISVVPLEESLLTKEDQSFNIENWKKGTVLFITGISGSGKTTVSNKFKEECQGKVEVFHLDVALNLQYPKKEALQRIDDRPTDSSKYVTYLFKEFVKKLPNDCFDFIHQKNQKYLAYMTFWDNISRKIFEFTKEVETQLDPNIWYIFEGTQVFKGFDPEYFVDKPLLIVNTGRIKSGFRGFMRETNSSAPLKDKLQLLKHVFRLMKYQKQLDLRKDEFSQSVVSKIQGHIPSKEDLDDANKIGGLA